MKLNTFLIIIGLSCFVVGTAVSYLFLNYRYQNNMPPLVSVTMKECSNCSVREARNEGYQEGFDSCVEEVKEQMSQEVERERRHSYQQMVIIN